MDSQSHLKIYVLISTHEKLNDDGYYRIREYLRGHEFQTQTWTTENMLFMDSKDTETQNIGKFKFC